MKQKQIVFNPLTGEKTIIEVEVEDLNAAETDFSSTPEGAQEEATIETE